MKNTKTSYSITRNRYNPNKINTFIRVGCFFDDLAESRAALRTSNRVG